MLEDFRLKVFKAVAENRSFTKAAVVLRITQPAVSQNIAELEKTVGAKLFDRLKGETVLTTEGRVFMEYANRLLAVCSSADNMFTKLPTSTVRISASEEVYNYFISPSVEAFAKVHPEITFERALFDDAERISGASISYTRSSHQYRARDREENARDGGRMLRDKL